MSSMQTNIAWYVKWNIFWKYNEIRSEIVSFALFNNNNNNNNNSLYFSSLSNSNLKTIETNDYVYTNEI